MPSPLLLDPWPPDYDSAVQIDETEFQSPPQIDLTVEMSQWQPVRNHCSSPFKDLAFVDGVRRVEARVIIQEPRQLIYGLFGAVGVGNVLRTTGSVRISSTLIHRYLILGAGKKQSETIRAGRCPLEFEGIASALNTPPDMVAELQNLMRTAEAALGLSLLSPTNCVFVDGPLTYFSTSSQPLVGIIKRIHRLYLPSDALELLARLDAGERTPLFMIADGKYNRYSCYLRLTRPLATEHPYAGIIRIEVRAAVGLETTLNLADFACQELPSFASSRIRDPRAPQNLLPVGALEDELKRRLGDPVLIQRGIQQRIFEGVQV
jgi:uncharacterized protein